MYLLYIPMCGFGWKVFQRWEIFLKFFLKSGFTINTTAPFCANTGRGALRHARCEGHAGYL